MESCIFKYRIVGTEVPSYEYAGNPHKDGSEADP